MSIEDASEQLRIARETARSHLKSAFSKTGTHRQSELISLIAQLT
jgi:DNA-binding CsgD family transcriptional regulator